MKWLALAACGFLANMANGAAPELPVKPLTKYGRFHLAAAPDSATLERFKREGGGAIIDLRGMSEGDCGESIKVTKMGMQYYRAPMKKESPVTVESVAMVDQLVDAAGDKPVLLFCSTQNRAAAWLAVHLVKREKRSVDEAIEIAKSYGLKTSETAVRQFLARTQ